MRRCLEAARQGQATDAEDLTPLHTEGLLQWGAGDTADGRLLSPLNTTQGPDFKRQRKRVGLELRKTFRQGF